MLNGYERARETLPSETAPHGRRPDGEAPATRIEIEKLADHWQERLTEAGFFFPPEKAPAMQLTLRNLWSRLPLTRADTRIFHGMLRQLIRRD